jgi:hypothetical protein
MPAIRRPGGWRPSRALLLFALLGGAWAALTVFALPRYPAPYVEDGWMGSRGHEFMVRGDFGLTTHADFFGSAQNWRSVGRLYVVSMALFYWATGFGLVQARLFSLLGSLVAAWFIYRLGQRFSGPAEGLLGAALSLLAWRGFYAGHLARPEAWVMAGGAAALYALWTTHPSERPLPWAGAGLLAALCLDIHATAVHFLAAFLFGAGWLLRPWAPRWGLAAGLGLGLAAGTVYFVGVHFLPDPALALKQYRHFTPPLAELGSGGYSVLRQAQASITLWASAVLGFTRLSLLETACFAGGVAVCWFRRERANRFLLAALLGLALSFTFANPGYNPRHVAVFVPLTSLVVARAAVSLGGGRGGWPAFTRLNAAARPLLLSAPLLAAYLLGDAVLAWNNRLISYAPYAAGLRALAPPGANVLGEEFWYFEFHDGRYTSDFMLTEDPALKSPASAARLAEIFREREIEFVLLDEQLAQDFDGTPLPEPEREALRRHVAQHCRRVGIVTGYLYGVESGGPRLKTTEVYDCQSAPNALEKPAARQPF